MDYGHSLQNIHVMSMQNVVLFYHYIYYELNIYIYIYIYISRPARKPPLWTRRKVSTRISFVWIFCFSNRYTAPVSPWDGMYRPGSVCADCAGWSRSIHDAEAILLVFSREGSYIHLFKKFTISKKPPRTYCYSR